MTTAESQELAAGLHVAMEAGLLTAEEAIRVVDREIEAAEEPPRWLVNASLSKGADDLMAILREAAANHVLVADVWAKCDAMDLALARGVSAMQLAPKINQFFPDGKWPRELAKELYDVDEEVWCAHGHGGVPQPRCVTAALERLLAAARGRSGWRDLLTRIAS